MDKKYLEAVKKGDMETAQKMVYKAANSRGYGDDTSWKMQHTAPNSKDDVSLWGLKESGLIPNDFWAKPEYYTYTAEERESYYKVKRAVELTEKYKAEGKMRQGKPLISRIWVYRAVDKTMNTKEDYFRNGDWVTPSYDYAVNEGKMNPNGYRIIKHSVPIDMLYWDGNSIAELGYDDGNTYAYSDTKNNRKLLDAVTYDASGNVIPLSKRFNKKEYDVRYSVKDDKIKPIAKRVADDLLKEYDSEYDSSKLENEITDLYKKYANLFNGRNWRIYRRRIRQYDKGNSGKNIRKYASLRGGFVGPR